MPALNFRFATTIVDLRLNELPRNKQQVKTLVPIKSAATGGEDEEESVVIGVGVARATGRATHMAEVQIFLVMMIMEKMMNWQSKKKV